MDRHLYEDSAEQKDSVPRNLSSSEEERTLRFLVDLNAATQSLSNPNEIMKVAARMLGEHLGVDRCAYAEIENEDVFVITGDYPKDVPSIVGNWPVASFGQACVKCMLDNEAYVVVDSETDERLVPDDLPAYRATNIRGVICVPLHKQGIFSAAMAVHQKVPRVWTDAEIELVEMVVARCWESIERARTLRNLQENERRMQFVLDSMPQKIFTANPAGEVDYFNPQWSEFTGLSFDQIRDWGWTQFIHPDDLEENVARWKHSIETGEPFEMENRFRRKDGVYRWHLSRATAFRGPVGEVLMWIGSNTEIHDLKEAQDAAVKAVGELETFNYSVSHDLRGPLRAIHAYSRILAEEVEHSLLEENKKHLHAIADNAEKMGKLLDGLLELSRLGRGNFVLEPTDLKALAHDAWLELQPRSGGSNVEMTIADLPTAPVQPVLAKQVFSNLLSNSLKYRPLSGVLKIEVGHTVRDDRPVFFVRDNGIGFDMKYKEKIFKVFERLHTNEEYEGTGIGLATVQRIVHRHGGEIQVESAPGKGACFYFTFGGRLTL